MSQNTPAWIVPFLKFAGFYNLAWAVFILSKPLVFYKALNQGVSEFPIILYPLGFLVMALGIAYLFAAVNPPKYILIILIGFSSKLGGLLGINWLLLADKQPNLFNFALSTFFNDFIWIIPFGIAFYKVFKANNYKISN